MKKKLLLFACSVVVTLLLSSCVTFEDSLLVEEGSTHEAEMGYIYGHFALYPEKDNGVPIMYLFGNPNNLEEVNEHYFGLPTISLHIAKNSFRLCPNNKDMIQMIALPAGTYSIEEMKVLHYEHTTKPEAFDLAGFDNNIVVKPNTATYIGHFSGTFGKGYDNEVIASLDGVEDYFVESYLEVQRKYQELVTNGVEFESHFK